MKQTYLLDLKENFREVVSQEKYRFLKEFISAMNISIDFWKSDGYLTASERNKLRQTLSSFNLTVIEHLDGRLEIFHEGKKIGEWNKCTFKLKKDLSQLDPKKQKYIEMQTDYWTIFDE